MVLIYSMLLIKLFKECILFDCININIINIDITAIIVVIHNLTVFKNNFSFMNKLV